MDFRDNPAEAAFRAELRAWLESSLPDEWRTQGGAIDMGYEGASREWTQRLVADGWAGLSWPEEAGGRGASPLEQAIFLDETVRAQAPPAFGQTGLQLVAPALLAFGTNEQKAHHLPAILRGEAAWCQGFSEPGSGSDLASVRTAARRDGDAYVVDGQKVWSSYAHLADWCFLLVATDPQAPRYRGLSLLLVDMRTPGVEVRPLRQLNGDPEFNEIFFSGVRVPAGNLLGPEGDGWKVAMQTLSHERGTLMFELGARLEVLLRRLLELARERGADADPLARDRLARLWIEVRALRLANLRAISALQRTGELPAESSIAKLVWSECNQRLTKLAVELLGPRGALADEGGSFWQWQQLRSRGTTIEAGTSEILRDIVAERVLGLPRSR
jgi:alkylation response protein AidB-like acyl-CoA dehydrogenase